MAIKYKFAHSYPYLLMSLPRRIGRISSAVLWRSASLAQLASISLRFSVDMMNASLLPVFIPILEWGSNTFDFPFNTTLNGREYHPRIRRRKIVGDGILLNENAQLFIASHIFYEPGKCIAINFADFGYLSLRCANGKQVLNESFLPRKFIFIRRILPSFRTSKDDSFRFFPG